MFAFVATSAWVDLKMARVARGLWGEEGRKLCQAGEFQNPTYLFRQKLFDLRF